MAGAKDRSEGSRGIARRDLLAAACAAGLAGAVPSRAADEEFDASAPPRAGDLLVFAFGARAGEVVTAAEVAAGAPQVFAYPMEPVSRGIKNGTRLNQILLVRADPARLTGRTRERAADGVVAYSGVCTHTGCDVTDWDDETRRFQCPCHESQFDPSDGARVVGGPAPLPLAALPLTSVDGRLAAAGPFEGRVGFQPPGGGAFGDPFVR